VLDALGVLEHVQRLLKICPRVPDNSLQLRHRLDVVGVDVQARGGHHFNGGHIASVVWCEALHQYSRVPGLDLTHLFLCVSGDPKQINAQQPTNSMAGHSEVASLVEKEALRQVRRWSKMRRCGKCVSDRLGKVECPAVCDVVAVH
jgi:hypothetical protein